MYAKEKGKGKMVGYPILTIIRSSFGAAEGDAAFLRSAASLALSWPDLGLEVVTPLL